MAKTVNAIQKQRTNTAANWAAGNPVLLAGQLGIVSDTTPKRMKVGDGITAWNSLPYAAEIPGIVSIEANKILGSNAAGTGFEFKESAALAQLIMLIYNDETDSSEVVSSTAESAALKSFDTLTASTYSKLIIEVIVQSRVEQSANTKCDFTYRLKKDGTTVQTWVDRIIASSTTGIVSGGRNTATFSFVIDGPFPSGDVYTVTSQNSLSNANTGSKIRAFRVYAVTEASLMRGADGNTPYIYNNYWYINGVNSGVLALGGINAGNTIAFTEAIAKDTLISGETIGVLIGKIKKWFSSFGSLAWKSSVDFAKEVTNKASTIDGYGISNAYTKTEVDAKIKTPLVYYNNSGGTIDIEAIINSSSNYTEARILLSQDTNLYCGNPLATGKTINLTLHNTDSVAHSVFSNFSFIPDPLSIPANSQVSMKLIGTGGSYPNALIYGSYAF